ncbi:MAG: hypothetical protein Q9214_007707, partial [Letrouitia sp. 1 TL-2023]
RPRQLVNRGFRSAVAEPAAQAPIVGNGAHARGHEREDGLGREGRRASGVKGGRAAREEGREMLDEQQGADGVGFEGGEGVGTGDVGGGLLRVEEDARDAEGEVEFALFSRGYFVLRGRRQGEMLACDVELEDMETVMVDVETV